MKSQILNLKSQIRSGQLMIVTVLILGGAILGASVIAGFITTRNIRQTTLANDSAKAIFAADSGLERLLYTCLIAVSCECDCSSGSCSGTYGATLQNNTSYEAVYTKFQDTASGACIYDEIRSVGFSDPTKRVSRALEIIFQ